MYYVQESDKPKILYKIFNIVELIEDKIILPIAKDEKIDNKKAKILALKTKKILEKTGCKKICVSKKIKEQTEYINDLRIFNIKIIEGKWLFSILINKILDYITNKNKIKKSDTTISILINKLDKDYIYEHIKNIIKEYKTVNIITNNTSKFKKLEEEIYQKDGIMINISNNKKKSLVRSKIILNIDFSNELINQYNLPENSIIININNKVKIAKKRFNGININDYEIKYLNIDEFDYDKYSLYEQKDIYESQIYQNQPFEYIKRKIERDKVEIAYLQGNKNKY